MIGQNDNINLEVNSVRDTLLRLYGLVYILLMAIIIGLGIIYLNNLNSMTSGTLLGSSSKTKDTAKVEGDLPMIKGTVLPPVDVMKYLNQAPEMLEKGKTLFQANCSSCHGPEGKGDGVAGINLNPKPRNFHDLNGWTNGHSLTQLYKTLQEGIISKGMASYNHMPPEERLDIILYIRTFNAGYQAVTKEQLDSIDVLYSLTKGFKQPNQIPVKLAAGKLDEEYTGTRERIKSIVSSVQKDENEGAVIMRRITGSTMKAVTVLNSDRRWMEDRSVFIEMIGTEPVYNGFRTTVYSLDAVEVTAVHSYLKNLFGSK